jgi:hypothetical protein
MILREPEIKLKRGGSSAVLQAMSKTIDRATGEPIRRVGGDRRRAPDP